VPHDPPVVVITGAGSGIGRELALVAGRQDTRLVLVGRRQSTLDATAALLPGHPIDIFQLDVTDSLGRERLAAFLDAKYGRVDVLMNNAGRILVGPVGDLETADVSAMLETNLAGPILLTTNLLPLLRQSDRGHIVNIGSMLGDIAMPMFAAYGASKFGLRGWSDGLRRELRHEGIKVTYAAPRATRTSAASAFEHLIEPFGMRLDTPEMVARRVWRDVRKGHATSYPFGIERLACGLQAVIPGMLDRVLSGQFRKIRSETRS